MKKSIRTAILSTTVSVIGLGAALPPQASAQAQNDEDEAIIEEIVVTARRRAESLRDVPGTVSALTETTLQNADVERAEDFISLTPGVTIVDAAEVGDTQVNIRGINGARDAENSFAFIVDGILYTNPAAFNREFTDLRQIEIFKGPQGAIYGRNAAAGAIIVKTNQPDNLHRAYGEASFANDDTYTLLGSVSGPLVEDELFFRLSGNYRTTDGFFRNSFLDRKVVDEFENYDIKGRLVWEPSPGLSFDYKIRYGQVDASAITFNSVFHLPVFADAFGNPAAAEDVNEHQFTFQPNVVSDNDQESIETSLKMDYEQDWGSITAWLLYSDIQNEFIADGTSAAFGFFNSDPVCQQTVADLNAQGLTLPPPQILGSTPVPIIFTPDFSGSFLGAYTPTTCDGIQEQIRDQEDISFEIRLASPTAQDLRWMSGIYFLTIDRQVGVSLNRDSGDTPIRGLLQESGPNRTVQLVFDDFDSTVFAVFGQLEYDVTPELEISAALRYDRENREVSNLVPTNLTQSFIDLNADGIFNDPLNPGLSDIINPSGSIPDAERTFEQVQPKISATYDASDEVTLFASWGLGFKAGGFNNQGSAATVDLFINNAIEPFANDLGLPLVDINDTFDKETSSAFEAGFKARLMGGRLNLEGAGYFIDVDDMQFFEFLVGSFGLLRVVSNIDNVDIYGFEFAASAQLHEYMSLYAGFNVTDSEIKSYSARPDAVGNKSPYTPDYTINAGSEFTYPVWDGMNAFLRVDAQVVGPTWFHTIQDQQRPTIFMPLFEIAPVTGPGSGGLGITDLTQTRRDTFHTINIRGGFQGETWSLMGFARNLTNNKYLEEVIPAPEFGGTFDHPAARRRYGVELSITY